MFESFPNDLLHEIFEYLDAAELFHAFLNLNIRFNTILFNYFHGYRINFHCILKYQFDFLVQQHLSLIANQTISLRLSDKSDESSPQTDFFYSSGLQLHQFIHLRSLSLCYIHDEEILHKMIIDCINLPRLTHLKVIKCHRNYMSTENFSNFIWSLSTLSHCQLDMENDFRLPTVTSLSIEYLSISCQHWWLSQTTDLIEKTPHLRYLHVPLNNFHDYSEIILLPFVSIRTLKLSHVESLNLMKTILLVVPNLIHLKVDTYSIDWNGYSWENIINNYMPKLKVFQLRMHIQFYGEKNNDQHANYLIDSFRIPFWLEKHQWYIRYHHYKSRNTCRSILLYTLPYSFSNFDLKIITVPYKSTCPQDNNYWSYDKVNSLHYDASLLTDHRSFIKFFNIRSLHIHLPFDQYFCQIIPTLHQLTSLTVLSANENAQFDLQSLLDRAPHLYSLTIRSWPASQVPVVQNITTSLRRLDLRMDGRVEESSFFTREECNHFIHSSLARQCDELLIKVESHESMLDLINNMSNLRILFIQCKNYFTPNSYRSCKEELSDVFVNWLQHQLGTTCIISKYKSIYNRMKIWICLKNHQITAVYIC